MSPNKLRVRQVPASELRPGDMFIDSAGVMGKVVFRCQSIVGGGVRYSCIGIDGFPSLVDFERGQMVIKVTDPRAYAAQEA